MMFHPFRPRRARAPRAHLATPRRHVSRRSGARGVRAVGRAKRAHGVSRHVSSGGLPTHPLSRRRACARYRHRRRAGCERHRRERSVRILDPGAQHGRWGPSSQPSNAALERPLSLRKWTSSSHARSATGCGTISRWRGVSASRSRRWDSHTRRTRASALRRRTWATWTLAFPRSILVGDLRRGARPATNVRSPTAPRARLDSRRAHAAKALARTARSLRGPRLVRAAHAGTRRRGAREPSS